MAGYQAKPLPVTPNCGLCGRPKVVKKSYIAPKVPPVMRDLNLCKMCDLTPELPPHLRG